MHQIPSACDDWRNNASQKFWYYVLLNNMRTGVSLHGSTPWSGRINTGCMARHANHNYYVKASKKPITNPSMHTHTVRPHLSAPLIYISSSLMYLMQ